MPKIRFAIISHFYYPDKVDQLFDAIELLNEDADVYATTSELALQNVIRRAEISKYNCKIIIIENRGRDVAPFFYVLNNFDIIDYDIVLKVHTKKSSHLGTDGEKWAESHLKENIGNRDSFIWIERLFREIKDIGMVFHEKVSIFSDKDKGENKQLQILIKKYRLDDQAKNLWNFSGGTMFYTRGSALKELKNVKIQLSEFEEEEGQLDNTFAHAMERLFPLFTKKAGYSVLSADYPAADINKIRKEILKMKHKNTAIFSTERRFRK